MSSFATVPAAFRQRQSPPASPRAPRMFSAISTRLIIRAAADHVADIPTYSRRGTLAGVRPAVRPTCRFATRATLSAVRFSLISGI